MLIKKLDKQLSPDFFVSTFQTDPTNVGIVFWFVVFLINKTDQGSKIGSGKQSLFKNKVIV